MDVLSLFGINLLSNTEPILIKLHLVFSQGIHIGNVICHMQAKFSTKAQKNPHIRTYKNQIFQKKLQLCYPLELHCSSIVKKKNIYFIWFTIYFINSSLSISQSLILSLLSVLTHSFSLDLKLHSHHPLIISLLSLVADQCGGVEIGVWGLAQRLVFRCGVEIGDGLWVCRGFCLGLLWVALVRIGVGFSWWLSAWVSSKVVDMGFGVWTGGGMVMGTMIGQWLLADAMVVLHGGGWVFSLSGPRFSRFL